MKHHHCKYHHHLCCCPYALWPQNLGDQDLQQSKENHQWPHQMVSRFCFQTKWHQLYKWLLTIKQKDDKGTGISIRLSDLFWPPVGHGSSSGKAFCSNCFWRRPVPGKTSMLTDFTSCVSESSSGLKPNLVVQVSTSSDIAGMINFSTLRDLRIWNGKTKENNNNHQKSSIKQDIKLNIQLLWPSSI